MKGALLAFGGERGANIALMVEVLAAGLSRRQLVARCAVVHRRTRTVPAPGCFVLAIEPKLLDPRFREAHERAARPAAPRYGVHIPGRARAEAAEKAAARGITAPKAVVRAHLRIRRPVFFLKTSTPSDG